MFASYIASSIESFRSAAAVVGIAPRREQYRHVVSLLGIPDDEPHRNGPQKIRLRKLGAPLLEIRIQMQEELVATGKQGLVGEQWLVRSPVLGGGDRLDRAISIALEHGEIAVEACPRRAVERVDRVQGKAGA